MTSLKHLVYLFSLLLFIIFGWELFAKSSPINLTLLPIPSQIIHALSTHYDLLITNALVTFKEMLVSIVLSLFLAFPLAFAMYNLCALRKLLQPLFILMQSIPLFVLAPILVIWLGWSQAAIIIPTTIMITIPLTLSLYQGFRSVDPAFIDYFHFLGASKLQMLRHLYIPHSRLYLFSGLRICATISGIGAIGGEWAGAQEGLGMLILESRRSLDLPMTFAALFILIALSTSMYLITVAAEALFKPEVIKKLHMKTVFVCTLPILLFTLAFPSSSHEPFEQNLTECRIVLDWLPNPNHVPLFVALEEKLFEQEGLDATILKIRDPGDITPYLISNQAEIGVGYMIKTLREIDKGAPLTMICPLIQKPLNGFLSLKSNPITKPEDLNGATIGTCSDGFSKRMLVSMLDHNEIQEMTIKNVSFDLVPALASGLVDVIYGAYWNIEQVQCAHMGIELAFMPLAQLQVPDHSELILCCSSNLKNKALIGKIQRVMDQAYKIAHRQPEYAFNLYARSNNHKSPQTLSWEKKAWLLTEPLVPYTAHFFDKQATHIHSWLLNNNHIQSRIDLDRHIHYQ